MRIHAIEIDGFRGVKSGKVRFGDFTVLIGPNNSGKTTIIEALALLFGRDRLVRSLTEHDFYGSCPRAADRIKVVASIADFAPMTLPVIQTGSVPVAPCPNGSIRQTILFRLKSRLKMIF